MAPTVKATDGVPLRGRAGHEDRLWSRYAAGHLSAREELVATFLVSRLLRRSLARLRTAEAFERV